MEIGWRWNRLSPTEKRVAEFLLEGKSNKDICGEMFLSRARVQECIKRIVMKTGAESTRSAITLLAECRETLALLRVLEQATDGVAIVQDGVCMFANRAVAEICGYTLEEIVGMPFLEFAAPEDEGLTKQTYEDRISNKEASSIHRIKVRCKDGHIREVEVAGEGIVRYNGRPAIMVVVRRDG
ncbi:MAG: PAS domain S-box protein [Dehalococcoidia bacterium]